MQQPEGAKQLVPKGSCVCGYCRKVFKPKHSNRKSFCTRECAFAAMAAVPCSRIYAGYCVGCGSAFVARKKRLYCAKRCGVRWVSVAPEVKQCRCCGESYSPAFTGGRPSEYCSSSCLSLVQMATRRTSKLKRKAAKRAVTVETVDPIKVFDRDKWKCQLCGIKTPKAKRGTYDGNAPELDHIVPLAKGGEHSYRNTQCACRRCNGLKSDRPLGQLRLIG